jgi:two-component system cell cycle sensor histidine kinase/response regulator CckA
MPRQHVREKKVSRKGIGRDRGKARPMSRMLKADLVAELAKKEMLLRQAEERYQTLLEEVSDVVFTANLGGPWLDVNPAGVTLFNFDSPEELLRADATHGLYVNPGDREKLERALVAKGHVGDVEIAMKKKGGESLTVRTSAKAIRDERGTVVAYQGVLKDVTEQRTLEQQLLQSQKMESIGLMTGGVAHDFNNLLMVILGNVQLGLAGMDRSHPHYEILSKIQEEAKKASAITRRLLAFTRRHVLQRKAIHLVDQINTLSKMLSRLIGEDIELKIEVGKEVGYVYLDETVLDQVVMNLVVNAREAMPDGGVLTLQVLNVSLDEAFCGCYPFVKPGDYVRLSIIDTGVGMEPCAIQRIFEPFFTTKEGGTGLGLAVVYGVVKQHKGYIIASSEVGKGSRFDIYFPIHLESISDEDVEVLEKAVSKGNETLLIAEDELEIRTMLKTFLEGLGYSVLVAQDGQEALHVFSAHQDQIDLVILDAVMPRLSGPKVYGQMRSIRPTLPCILLTGYGDEMIKKHSAEGLEIPVLRKPVTFEELGRKIRDVLDQPGKTKGCA